MDAHYTSSVLIAEIARLRVALRETLPILDYAMAVTHGVHLEAREHRRAEAARAVARAVLGEVTLESKVRAAVATLRDLGLGKAVLRNAVCEEELPEPNGMNAICDVLDRIE